MEETYVIGSGWWCDGTGKHAGSKDNVSSDKVRHKEFFDTWYKHIKKFSNPKKIIVVDADSPVKPDPKPDVELISLIKNPNYYGSFNKLFGTNRTGCIRQIFIGAVYAFMNDIDYYVWIEQDCLIYGKGIIEAAINNMKDADFSLGIWDGIYKREVSFVIFKTKSILKIIEHYISIQQPKPELKFYEMEKYLKFKELPFGYGRNRPINFDDDYFYAQHLTDNELDKFEEKYNETYKIRFSTD